MTASVSPVSETRTFRAATSDVAEIDRWMEALGAQWKVAERAMFRARVCVAELVANALEHGGASPERDAVTITLQQYGPDLGIEYADTTTPFDPTTLSTPSDPHAEDVGLGGRGLRLLHAYASHLSYRHDGRRNVVSFRVTGEQPSRESRASPALSC
jgi:anti-sigma regulatory factor (Ser/Thr protein kinase)